MKCKFALLLGMTVALAVSVGVWAPTAAYAYVTEPYADASFETELTQLLDGTLEPVTVDSGTTGTLVEAAVAGGRLPALSAIGAVALIAGVGFDVGWRIGRVIDTKFLHLSDPDCVLFGCPAQPSGTPQWTQAFVQPIMGPNVALGLGSGLWWVYEPSRPGSTPTAVDCGDGLGREPSPQLLDSTSPTYTGGNSCTAQALNVDERYWAAQAVAAGFTKYPAQCTGYSGWLTVPNGSCFVYAKPSSAIDGTIHTLPQPYTNQNVTVTTTMGTSPTGSMTSAQQAAARAVIAASSSAKSWADCELDPADYACPGTAAATSGNSSSGGTATGTANISGPVVLPEPLPDESYEDYSGRLRQLGWTRQIVLVNDPMTYPPGSPGALVSTGTVTGVRIGTTGAFTTAYDGATGLRVLWPLNPPQTATSDTEIDLQVRPGTLSPQLQPGDCSTCTINWTPLESLSFGTKFPFGIYGWMTSNFQGFSSSGTCPTLHIPLPASIGGTDEPMSFCSSTWETDYRPWVFPLVEAAMTFLAVWFLARKIIGMNADGDD